MDVIPGHFNKQLDKLSNLAVATIQTAKAPRTLAAYKQVLKLWHEYCVTMKIPDSTNTSITNIVNYLSLLKEQNRSYSIINTTRSALSQSHSYIESFPVGKHPLVISFCNGLKRQSPIVKVYAQQWDVAMVFNVLSGSIFSPNESIHFKRLQQKCIVLTLLTTACRISTLERLRVGDNNVMQRSTPTDHFVLQPVGFDKTGSFKAPSQPLHLFVFSNPNLCPFRALQVYLERCSSSLQNEHIYLFPNLDCHEAIPKVTYFRGKLGQVMDYAKVPDNFKAHSVRGAATSKAHSYSSTEDILKAGIWTNAQTFLTHYLSKVVTLSPQEEAKQAFQGNVLKGFAKEKKSFNVSFKSKY